ncbi:MAG TPA: NifB/NifX family molybdenum-iron cluster-binding protein, partial [Phycisphaerae bacterium]|nr:NifB/NifX family molybdenum-iron cluster-binding protein [Phycisphaerae bacterium]
MRIAIPVSEENVLAEEFSRAGIFAIYDVHDQTRAVGYVGRQTLAEPGCGKTPGFLRGQSVEVVLGHGVSQNAENHLLEVGIVAIKDAPMLPPDA